MPMTAGQLEQMIQRHCPMQKSISPTCAAMATIMPRMWCQRLLSAKPVCNSTKWFTTHWAAAWAIRCTLWPCKLPFPMTPEGGRYERN